MRNKKKNANQKRQKGGISLIVLVMTIVVMVILVASVIVTLNNTQIMNSAQGAVNSTNLKQVQQLAGTTWLTAISDGVNDQAELQTAVNDYLTSCGIDPNNYYITVTTSGVDVRLDAYTYNIVENLTNIVADTNNKITIKENESVTLAYVADEGYELPDTVTVTGASSTWNKVAGTLVLTNPTGNVSVTITGEATTAALPEGWNEDAVVAVVDTVPIPKGFVASPYSDENTKDGGLVIYELATGETAIPSTETQQTSWTTRNQYVWVPVDNFTTEFVRTYYGTGTSDLSNTLGEIEKYWEATLDLTTNLPLTTQDTTYLSTLTLAEVQAMYASVRKYGGFYIARYEMGIDAQRQAHSNLNLSEITVYSKMNKIPFTYLAWTMGSNTNSDSGGAVEAARSIYTASNTNYGAVSTLVYDVQWDRTVNWIANAKLADKITTKYTNILTNSTNYGNYKDHAISSRDDLNEGASYAVYSSSLGSYTQVTSTSTISKNTSTSWLLTTGALKAAKTNNIYDMAGNVKEWTMGGFTDEFFECRVCRGGGLNDNGSSRLISFRGAIDGATMDNDLSSRVALYVK